MRLRSCWAAASCCLSKSRRLLRPPPTSRETTLSRVRPDRVIVSYPPAALARPGVWPMPRPVHLHHYSMHTRALPYAAALPLLIPVPQRCSLLITVPPNPLWSVPVGCAAVPWVCYLWVSPHAYAHTYEGILNPLAASVVPRRAGSLQECAELPRVVCGAVGSQLY
jgi:hypothetical protein